MEENETVVSSSDDSSDDDLPIILQKSPMKQAIKTATEILTPRRSIKPVGYVRSPLLNSPSSTNDLLGGNRERKQKKSRISITDLLKEKKHDDEIQDKVNDIIKMEGKKMYVIFLRFLREIIKLYTQEYHL